MTTTNSPSGRRAARVPRRLVLAALALAGAVSWQAPAGRAQAPGPCTPPNGNAITCENALPGNPWSEWGVDGVGDQTIQGFATAISVAPGQIQRFKVKSTASAYRIDIYRLGYYDGLGARKVATVLPSVSLPQNQPNCLSVVATGLVDCGNWSQSASWTVPATAVSGIYIGRLVRTDNGGASHIVFIVRDDTRRSDLLFQTSDTTWHAYNSYGGNSLYVGAPAGRAYKVSYNRPFNNRAFGGGPSESFLFNAEFPMLMWLEANGFDVSYSTGVDTDQRPAELLEHKAFLSVGHDEYWSGAQRSNIEAARNAGVHLAFFSGNEMFWKTRWESSIDGTGSPYRTLVSYKETHAGAKIDPMPNVWTGTWRDARFSPPADGGRPENAVTGTLFMVNGTRRDAITVPAAEGRLRFWRHTSIASLPAGGVASLPLGTLGYEWDVDADNGSRPAGLIRMSSTTLDVSPLFLQDNGSTYGNGIANHALTLYKHASGALVFGAGTVQWSWGLDDNHDHVGEAPDVRMQQATVNLFADMGAQPMTLQGGLVTASKSTDTAGPGSAITSPTAGTPVQVGTPITITGTANDGTGGVVGAVEVSVNNGPWRPAAGREAWSIAATFSQVGSVTIRSRAVDDSGNIGAVSTVTASVVTDGPPAISGVQVSATSTSATVTWNTNENSNSQVEYGLTASYGSMSPLDATMVTAHTVGLSGLTPNTTYHFRVRSRDGSGNLAISGNGTFTTAATATCPCSLWPATTTPAVASQSDTDPVELGVRFRADQNGVITGLRFYKGPANSGQHVAHLWTSTGTLMATATFANETASGWQQVAFASPVAVTANTVYIASYYAPNGGYAVNNQYFNTAYTRAPLHAPASAGGAGNGLFRYGAGGGFPTSTYQASNYWVDVVFSPGSAPADTVPPVISGAQVSVSTTSATFTWTTNEPANGQVEFGPSASYGSLSTLATALTIEHSVVVTGLTPGTTYHGRLRSRDAANNLGVSSDATFTTTAVGTCPCTLWPSTATPAIPSQSDTNAVEVGMRFRTDTAGSITRVRFYKGPANSGQHVAHLWTNAGALLATATFTGESASGWQEVAFASPVAIAANTTYVVSYYAPNGGYALDAQYFAGPYDNAPLHAPADAAGANNGVYRYGTGGGFPTSTYQAANYWVDVVFVPGTDTTPPTISGIQATPSANSATVSWTTNEAADSQVEFGPTTSYGSLSGLDTQLTTGHSIVVNGLSASTTYHYRVRSRDGAGNLSVSPNQTLVTSSAASCPCTIWPASATPAVASQNDTNAVEIGVRFRATQNGFIRGIRFYKGPGNTGQHVAHLWTNGGSLLATATFTSETASGWQQVTFASPVAITANTTYVASYYTPSGGYAVTTQYFTAPRDSGPLRALADGTDGGNGVYRYGAGGGFPTLTYQAGNYWVDVVFTP